MHGHMGPWPAIYFPRARRAMIGTMDECGVRLLVFSHHQALFAPDMGNRAQHRCRAPFPDRLRAYCVINPNYPEQAAATWRPSTAPGCLRRLQVPGRLPPDRYH